MFAVLFLCLILALLVFKSLGLGLDKRVIVAVVRVDALAVKMQNVRRNYVQKLAVVRDDQNCRRPRLFATETLSRTKFVPLPK